MAVSISMNIIQSSQRIEDNTSNVTVELYAHWTRGSYNAQTAPDGYPDARGTVSIDNVQYTFYSKFNTGHTTSGSERIFAKTLDISHNDEGEKVLLCWASYATGVSSGTVTTSGSLALTTIPRKSVLHVSEGTLGAEQVLKVERKSSLLTHAITYRCGTESGVICEKTRNTDIVWTPPISLAAQYPNAISVPIVFTVTTYHDNTEVGASAVTVTYAIPESVKPAASLEVSDIMGCFSKYGAYVQKKSRLRIVATASGNQGSRITAYRIEADGKTYTNSSVITEPLSGSGDLTVKVTVTDTRGRIETASITISVMAYASPNVSAVSVDRTDEKGNVNSSGAYLTVRFSAAVTALSGKNSAVYTLQYKKANENYYFTYTLTDYTGRHTVNNGVFTFAAETVSSYNIIVAAADDFESGSKTGAGSSIKKSWSMLKHGLGFAFGKIAERANTLDMGWNIELNQNEVLRDGKLAYVPNQFGLGTEAVSIGDASVDTLDKTGFYFGYNGLPDIFGNSFIIHLDAHYYKKQLVYSLKDTAGYTNLVVMREMNAGTWGEWEWINPPMTMGEEFRTTERHNRKPVYCKLMSGGYLPNSGTKQYFVAQNATVISVDGPNIRSVNFGGAIPAALQSDQVVSCFVNGDTVLISCGGDRSGISFYFTAKYTKTTD